MAQQPVKEQPWRLMMPSGMYQSLHGHMYPGDGDEHAAVLLASMVETPRGVFLLARDLRLAVDGVDFVPSTRGYRKLRGQYITNTIRTARDERLVHLAIHNHGGTNSVGFSEPDYASHERGYPSLLKIAKGMPVGALVFAQNAVAADIWLPNGQRVQLTEMRVLGNQLKRLYSAPPGLACDTDAKYDRQTRLFGAEGQAMLAGAKVGIIGLGGAGSQLADHLAGLGVGEFVVIDPDRVETSNIPRLVGATRWHSRSWLTDGLSPGFIKRLGRRMATSKAKLAETVIRRANPSARVKCIVGDFCDPEHTQHFVDCDFIFMAADTHRARLKFNALVHQYLIPSVQVGAKVSRHTDTGEIADVYSVVRPVMPETGCLYCNGLINSANLQKESCSEEELEAQNYGLPTAQAAASIVTLNAIATAQAANDFMIWYVGLASDKWHQNQSFYHALRRCARISEPRKDDDCPFCGTGDHSALGAGNNRELPE